MSKFNDPNYYPSSATSSSWSLFKQTFMNGKPKKKKTGTTSAKKPSTSSSSTSSSSLNHPGVRASLPNPHNAPRYSDDSSSNGNESPVMPVLDNSQSTPNLPFQRNHSMTDFAMENQEKYEGYEDSEPVFATEEETPLSSSSNSSSSALTTGELSQSSLTSYQQRPLPPIPSDTSLSNLDESNSTPVTPGLDALVDTIVEETQEDDTEAEQPFQDVTDMTQIKPSMLYHYVLRKFVKNIDGYDDHTCSDKFDEFITQYFELCTKLKDEGNEEMKEFFSWSDKEVRKLRDKEKPRTFLLHQCAKYNRSSLIFLLVSKYKCNIMAPDEAESTPMHYACNHRGYEAISILCQLKSKINIRDKFGKSPLQLLFNKAFIDEEIGDLQSAQEGFKSSRVMCGQFEGDYNFKTTDGSTILHMACEAGRLNAVKFLVSESAEVNSSGGMASSQTGNKVLINSKDNFGRTPIMRAAASGHINIVEYILTNTNPAVVFGPASRDDKKQNILHHAAVMGTDPLINRLAFLNPTQCASLMKEQDSAGNTPLHLAVQNANIKTVNLLLTLLSKDSMNVQNDKGETPLHSACRLKEKNVAERLCGFLYQSGASEKVKDKSGQTPKQLATENDLTVSFVKRKK